MLLLTDNHKKLWGLAGPIMISNITVALLGMVDTAVLGHLDVPHYLAAISLTMVIFNFLYWGLGFLRMGTTGQTAQAFGANHTDRIRAVLAQVMLVAVCISSIILLMQSSIINTSFLILNGSETVKEYGRIYFNIAIWASPLVLCNLVMTGWLIGMQGAKYTLMTAVAINLINIVLDLLFVWQLGMTINGVAWATVLAQFTGFLLNSYYVGRVLKYHQGEWKLSLIFHIADFKNMLSINNHIFLRTLSLMFVFAFFVHQSAAMGDAVLAANSILKNLYVLMALSLDGFATAAEALVGEAIGKRNREQFWQTVKTAAQWSVVFAIGFCVFFLLMGDTLIEMMTNIDSVKKIAKAHLIWMILAPLFAVLCFMWDGVYIGATRGKEMRDSMLFATVIVFLPVWYLSQGLNNHGLWFSLSLFLIARSILMSLLAYRIESQQGFVKE